MRRRSFFAWSLALLTVFSLAACTKKDSAESKTGGTDVSDAGGTESITVSADGTRWLTHIYQPQEMEVPEGRCLTAQATIDYDARNDTFRAVLERKEEEETADGFRQYADKEIAVWNGDGELISEIPLNDPGRMFAVCTCFSGDRLVCQLMDYNPGGSGGKLVTWDAGTGEMISEAEIKKIKGWSEYGKREIAVDGEGNIYAGDGSQVVILTPEYARLNTVSANTLDMAVTPAGEIWAVCPKSGGRGVFLLDPGSGQKTEIFSLEASGASLAFLPGADADGPLVAVSGANGISLCRPDEDGEWTSDMLLNFTNSDISYNSAIEDRDGSMKMAAAAGEDRLVFILHELDRDGMMRHIPLLYRKAPDLDLSTVRTVTLAHDRELQDNILYQIVRFNREHDDIRVTTLDYSSGNTQLNPTGGSWKLATDMLNGLIEPDVVIGYRTLDPIEQLMRKGLTVDLGAYLDEDPEVNRETVAGCVLRSFDDGNGGLWGIAPFFRIETVVGMSSVLGVHGDGWDLGAFLDFAESLPEGRFLTANCCRENRGEVSVDLGQFVGEDTCSFDSPLFIRYLGWLKRLPTSSDLRKVSPAAGLYGAQVDPYYADGTVALNLTGAYEIGNLVSLFDLYGEEETVFPGSPVPEGSGTVIEADQVFVIPTFSHDPDAAWEFVRSFLLADDLTGIHKWYVSIGLPSLRGNLIAELDDARARTRVRLQNGMTFSFDPSFTREYIESYLAQMYAGIPYSLEPYCTEEEAAAILELIDSCGRPFREELPDELYAIVSEEISGFIAGLGTAEQCAAKIQSRASIWLAENRG